MLLTVRRVHNPLLRCQLGQRLLQSRLGLNYANRSLYPTGLVLNGSGILLTLTRSIPQHTPTCLKQLSSVLVHLSFPFPKHPHNPSFLPILFQSLLSSLHLSLLLFLLLFLFLPLFLRGTRLRQDLLTLQ